MSISVVATPGASNNTTTRPEHNADSGMHDISFDLGQLLGSRSELGSVNNGNGRVGKGDACFVYFYQFLSTVRVGSKYQCVRQHRQGKITGRDSSPRLMILLRCRYTHMNMQVRKHM